eukprot:8787474-Pyramimonas_sp.AAC.1
MGVDGCAAAPDVAWLHREEGQLEARVRHVREVHAYREAILHHLGQRRHGGRVSHRLRHRRRLYRFHQCEAQVSSHGGPIGRRKRGYILTTDQSDAGSAGISSRRINQTQEAQVSSHGGPIGRRKRGYVLTADQYLALHRMEHLAEEPPARLVAVAARVGGHIMGGVGTTSL